MSYPAVNPIVRCLRVAPVIFLMFSGCTCSEEPAPKGVPTAAPQAPQQAPKQPPTAAQAAPAAQNAGQEAPPSVAAPTVAPPAAANPNTTCERYIAALSAKSLDSALLKDPGFQGFALQAPDLFTCAAVRGDSDAFCAPLIAPTDAGGKNYSSGARDCLYAQSMYHEVKAHPTGTSFMFHGIERQQCDDQKSCDLIVDALRTGDEAKCAQTGGFQSICRAFIKLDASLCKIEGKLPDKKKDAYDPAAIVDGCKKSIDSRRPLAQGLSKLAESGTANERALAQAALGQADACKPFEQAALKTCIAASAPPPPAQPTPTAAPPAPTEPYVTPGGVRSPAPPEAAVG